MVTANWIGVAVCTQILIRTTQLEVTHGLPGSVQAGLHGPETQEPHKSWTPALGAWLGFFPFQPRMEEGAGRLWVGVWGL